jgi:hypothetical protein
MNERTRMWVGVISRAHVLRGVAGGFTQVCHGKRAPLARMKPGDLFFAYSPTTELRGGEVLRAFTAVGVIHDDVVVQFDMGGGSYRFVAQSTGSRAGEGGAARAAALAARVREGRGLGPESALGGTSRFRPQMERCCSTRWRRADQRATRRRVTTTRRVSPEASRTSTTTLVSSEPRSRSMLPANPSETTLAPSMETSRSPAARPCALRSSTRHELVDDEQVAVGFEHRADAHELELRRSTIGNRARGR